MKFLRVLLIIIVILVVVIGLLTMVAPTEMSIKRSTVISAPREVVFKNISTFENLHKWYPWDRRDPAMKTSIEGTDGTVGAKLKWEGNKEVGQGEQTLTKIEPGKEVDMHLHFIKPFDGQAKSKLVVADTTGGTLATWQFSSTMPRPWNIMGLFMSTDALGKDFDEGLGYLKELSEKEAASVTTTSSSYTINEMDMPAKVFVGKRATVAFMDMGKFFEDNFPKIAADAQKANLEISGAPSGIFYTYDTVNMKSDMAVVLPVKEVKSPVMGWEIINAPPGKALEVDYYGAYDKSMPAYNAIDAYMAQKGMKSKSFVVEEYVTDPMVEKDTARWLTKIYYYVE